MLRACRVFNVVYALTWVGWGIWIFFWPDGYTSLTGVAMPSVAARTEMRATWVAIGVLFGALGWLGTTKPRDHLRTTMLVWSVTYVGLVVARLSGLVFEGADLAVRLGVVPEYYNQGTLWLYELPSAWMATWLYRRLGQELDGAVDTGQAAPTMAPAE